MAETTLVQFGSRTFIKPEQAKSLLAANEAELGEGLSRTVIPFADFEELPQDTSVVSAAVTEEPTDLPAETIVPDYMLAAYQAMVESAYEEGELEFNGAHDAPPMQVQLKDDPTADWQTAPEVVAASVQMMSTAALLVVQVDMTVYSVQPSLSDGQIELLARPYVEDALSAHEASQTEGDQTQHGRSLIPFWENYNSRGKAA